MYHLYVYWSCFSGEPRLGDQALLWSWGSTWLDWRCSPESRKEGKGLLLLSLRPQVGCPFPWTLPRHQHLCLFCQLRAVPNWLFQALSPTLASRVFPGGSDGKVAVYNAGDLGSIPGSGRVPGWGNGNPPYPWAVPSSCLPSPHWCEMVHLGTFSCS